MTVRVLITGSREFLARAVVAGAISAVAREHPGEVLIIVHGAARGADSIAGAVARDFPGRLVEEQHVVTDWGSKANGTFDRTAGHRRNQRMVDAGAVVCLAFPARDHKSVGTWSCVAKAKAAGIEVRAFWDRPEDETVSD
ncbi:uncharacterized protein DUF2493 [Rhodoglobus vestalii]|uniref:Uncharacterized protein DUF2493 n=1 Tax=Rhodoglobus vestalii TaxID=193384 RepID=A0A8H2K8L7_9MICO|nr:SLOG family protein [Rhodoglobus vestalii]TQO20674.1 uncharacterized protein DUF2493 [Rhodoglobus vestalii]